MSRPARFWAGSSFVVVLLGADARPAAWAYSCISSSCTGYCQSPVAYRLGTPSADLGLQATEAELKKGMEAWTKPSCSSLKVQYGGTTNDSPGNGNGVVAWAESSWGSGSGTIGTTTSRLSRGCLTAHMIMNGVNFRWVLGNPASRSEVNAFTIIAHEGGHFLGLGHSNASGSVMAARYSGGVIPLNADDEAGICKLYPGGGGSAVPGAGGAGGGASGSGGSAGGTGGAGGMSGGSGMGQLCAACQRGADCASGTCLRHSVTGELFCGRPCGDGCPNGYTCMPSTGTNGVNQCVPNGGSCAGVPADPPPSGTGGMAGSAGGGPTQGGSGGAGGNGGGAPDDDEGSLILPDGERCEVNDDCQSRLCVDVDDKAFCSRVCNSNADCVSGFACRKHDDGAVCLPIDGDKEAAPSNGEGGASANDQGGGDGCSFGGRSGGTGTWWAIGLLGLLFGGCRRTRTKRR